MRRRQARPQPWWMVEFAGIVRQQDERPEVAFHVGPAPHPRRRRGRLYEAPQQPAAQTGYAEPWTPPQGRDYRSQVGGGD